MEQIAVNCIANILGLGWAATPAGLKAMEELKNLEEERRAAGGFPRHHTGTSPAGERSRRLGMQASGGRRYPAVDTPKEIFSIFRSELPKMEIRNDDSWQ